MQSRRGGGRWTRECRHRPYRVIRPLGAGVETIAEFHAERTSYALVDEGTAKFGRRYDFSEMAPSQIQRDARVIYDLSHRKYISYCEGHAIFDRKMALWEYGQMKATIELPEALMKRVKLRAIHQNQKLKDAIAQLLELGLAASKSNGPPRAPKPVRLKTGRRLSIDDIEAAIGAGRK